MGWSNNVKVEYRSDGIMEIRTRSREAGDSRPETENVRLIRLEDFKITRLKDYKILSEYNRIKSDYSN